MALSQKLPKPTDAELAILCVLWQRGPSTVRQVHNELCRNRPTGYTTVLKFMQITAGKGLVRRDESSRAHVYEARIGREQTQRRIVLEVLDKAFGGSASQLVTQALASGKTSAEELAEIRRLLNELERGAK